MFLESQFCLLMAPASHSSSLPILFSLSSSSFNYFFSIYSAHLLPYLKRERFSFIDLPQIISNWGSRYRCSLCSTGTQNNNDSLSWPIIHPFFMSRSIISYPLWCLTVRSAVSWIMSGFALVISFVPLYINAISFPWLQNWTYR